MSRKLGGSGKDKPIGRSTDVVILHDDERAFAFRTPTSAGIDVFDPQRVFWCEVGKSV